MLDGLEMAMGVTPKIDAMAKAQINISIFLNASLLVNARIIKNSAN